MTQIDIAALVADLTTKSAMINMGEKIAWGSETALMDQAAAALIAQDAELKRLRAELARVTAERDRFEASCARMCLAGPQTAYFEVLERAERAEAALAAYNSRRRPPMTSDILKRAAEAELLPCPFCGGAAHLWDDASHSTASFIGCETEGCFGYILWAETATDAARVWNHRPDMAAAIAERDAEIERLTARAEAAEAMADRLAETVRDFLHGTGAHRPHEKKAVTALAAHAAMKEGR